MRTARNMTFTWKPYVNTSNVKGTRVFCNHIAAY
jgi:hypothetical protein